MHSFDGRVRPLSAAIALALLAPAAPVAIAQGAMIEEVVVTGSRIARDPNTTAANPIQSVTAEDIRLSGTSEPTEYLRQQPALLTSLSSEASADTGAPGGEFQRIGQSVLALRGMGAERTLVLVDGRRHVAGVEGSQSVDIGTIPSGLIDRIETLTGGASSVYGADAVTGVVNFILKDDFEGWDVNAQTSMDDSTNGRTSTLGVLFGQNFADGRGNFTIGVDIMDRQKMLFREQGFSRGNRIAASRDNPALRFQDGDITPGATPNFARFYSVDQGRYPYGFNISGSADSFLDAYEAEFGERPSLTSAELALIDRRANATPQVITPFPSFSIANDTGIIAPRDFLLDTFVDLDGDGVHDCLNSHQGFNSLLEPGFQTFGLAGGCWTYGEDGELRPYQDGLITSTFNSIGGDGIINADRNYLTPDEFRWSLNFTARYDLTPQLRVFGEAKYVNHVAEFGGPGNGFYDLLTVSPENPYIPAELMEVAQNSGGLFITRDPTDLGPNIDKNERETMRFVFGIEGEFDNGMFYEVSANYGRFDRTFVDRNAVIQDRYFAAIDAVADPVTGDPICRSDIDFDTRPPTTRFNIPNFQPGFFTFNPGDGQCVPISLFGPNASTQEAIDFVTTTVKDDFRLEQLVFSASLAGELPFFELPAGRIGFAIGAEYRDEKSRSSFDPLKLGIVPVDTPDAQAGQQVRDLPVSQNQLIFNGANIFNSASNGYDVYDIFAELRVPLLVDQPFARELTLETSYRFSDYSTVGTTHTWAYGGIWSPVDDVRIRGTRSRAVRAPNITELFEPPAAVSFNLNIEPCTPERIGALINAGDPTGPIRQANCAAELGADFVNPLSAGFAGAREGNANLEEETADTWTVGVVLQPRFLDGLTLTIDYWNIEIDDAISTISGEDILANCYDSPNFPDNPFCQLFDRNPDPASAQFQGLSFLRISPVNFAAIESSGVDLSFSYLFSGLGGEFTLSGTGSYVEKLDFFLDPADPTAVDPQLGQIQRPKWSGNASLRYRNGPWSVGWTANYQDAQFLRGVRAANGRALFGDSGRVGSFMSHDARFSYDFQNGGQLYAGLRNIFDKDPHPTERAWPVSPMGRSLFVGFNYAM